MEKKAYNKPELKVVKLTSRTHLLAGSESMEGGGGDAGKENGSSSSNPSRRASFSTFDGEE